MYASQLPYVQLFDRMVSYDGPWLYADVVRPWALQQDGERAWLQELAGRRGNPIPEASIEEISRLYAMSRISDLLLLSFAPWGADSADAWEIGSVTTAEYLELMTFLGFSRVDRTSSFHPFFHEVVSVAQDPAPDAPLRIEEELWPGFKLGELLFSRSGCRVAGGREHIVKEIAEDSTLYWAFARHTRPTYDNSVGWGSSSQWNTALRRDYQVDDTLYYNVDGDEHLRDEDLLPEEKLELLRHRCFVRCAKPHEDRWPFDLRHSERVEVP
jgi:hypothetical protein